MEDINNYKKNTKIISIQVCEGEADGIRACQLISNIAEKFFSLGISEIERVCNHRREELRAQWLIEEPSSMLSWHGVAMGTYKRALEETLRPFSLSRPEQISLFIWKTMECGDAPMAETTHQDRTHPELHVFLKKWQRDGDTFRWNNFQESFEDITIHELLHACGDDKKEEDGVIRHNIVGIMAVKSILS